VGALVGNYLGIMGYIGEGWFWFGNQGLSYIQLGRAWQIGFFAGLVIWSLLVFRALWPTRTTLFQATRQFWSGRIRLEHLIWASTVNIAVLYVFGMIPLLGIEKSFTISDFWRWWVVHLWVEQSFEFFAAAISAYLLMALGLVSRQLAERSVYLALILIFLGGVLGTGHHLYWAGEPGLWVPMGTMFSFIEVLPLVLLILEAIQQRQLIKDDREFKYGLAYTYIIGAAFWNFVGAGVFGGGTLNAPLVNYYEHGTFLTLNHAHTALFGAFGLLGIGLIYFCLRYVAADQHPFGERIGRWAFWLYNGGLVLWILLNFFPIGWPQLDAVYEHGLAYARSQEFYDTSLLWQWMRFPGDVVFAVAALADPVEGVSGPFPGAEGAEFGCGGRGLGAEAFELFEVVVGYESGVAAGCGVPSGVDLEVVGGPGKPPFLAVEGFPSCHGDPGGGSEAVVFLRFFRVHAGVPVRWGVSMVADRTTVPAMMVPGAGRSGWSAPARHRLASNPAVRTAATVNAWPVSLLMWRVAVRTVPDSQARDWRWGRSATPA